MLSERMGAKSRFLTLWGKRFIRSCLAWILVGRCAKGPFFCVLVGIVMGGELERIRHTATPAPDLLEWLQRHQQRRAEFPDPRDPSVPGGW